MTAGALPFDSQGGGGGGGGGESESKSESERPNGGNTRHLAEKHTQLSTAE